MKKVLLLAISLALIVSGGALLNRRFSSALLGLENFENSEENKLGFTRVQGYVADLHGNYQADSLDKYTFEWDGKDAFSLFWAGYKDSLGAQRNVILFPENSKAADLSIDPIGARNRLWQETADAIKQNTPEDALVIGWWNDSQRTHFYTGRKIWINQPNKESLSNPVWKILCADIQPASDSEQEKSAKLAHWLTMDSSRAIAEMRASFGHNKTVYLLLSKDLLLEQSDFVHYGGKPIQFHRHTFPVTGNLHGDIALIKRWTVEENAGNYLVQQEGNAYHVWGLPHNSTTESDSLLVRLLPFVDSFKKLPDGVKLVYQSHWGGYLSIFQLNFSDKPNT